MVEIIVSGKFLHGVASGLALFTVGIACSRLFWLRTGHKFDMRTCYAVEAIAFIMLALFIVITSELWNK